METDESRRERPEEEPGGRRDGFPTGEESPAQFGKTLLHGISGALVGRVFLLNGLAWLLVGGGLLTASWFLVQEEMERRERVESLSGRAAGVVESPWWRLDSDPEVLGDGDNWQAVTDRTACARLRYRPEGAEETVTTFCRRFGSGLDNGYALTWEDALGPMPVRWVDEAGMPRIELRLDPRLVRWLDARGPEVHRIFYDPETFRGPERARRADRLLGSVWRDLDDPFLRMLQEWSKPPSEVTVAYVPGDPARAAPLLLLRGDTVDDIRGGIPIWALVVPFGLFGLLAWGAGSYLVTGGSRRGAAVLLVVGVAGLPWLAGPAVKQLGRVWPDAELAVAFMRSTMMPLPPELVLGAPEEPGPDAEGDRLRIAWTLETSSYADLLRWIDLSPPPEGLDSDAVLRHLADQVRSQAIALPDDELAALLDWATEVQMRGGGEELGLLFVDAALELKDDPERSEEVRDEADALLRAVAFHEPSDNPYRLAVEERKRILARLSGRD